MRRPRRLILEVSEQGRIKGEMWAINEAIENVDSTNRDATKKAITSMKIKARDNLYNPYENIRLSCGNSRQNPSLKMLSPD
jgi:hypothetical protein